MTLRKGVRLICEAGLTLSIISLASVAFGQSAVRVTAAGAPQTLYRWADQRCEDEFIPDAPVRAFRRADGNVELLATHRENWALVGPNFNALKSLCRSLLRTSEHPGMGRLWILATYTSDGRNISALVTQDLRADTIKKGCDPQGEPARCWLNHIIAARSTDMGQTFQLVKSGTGKVATLGPSYPNQTKKRFGVFSVTNIVQKDGHYFTIASVEGEGIQRIGSCLLRTKDPHQPDQWRAWDGKDFTVDMGSTDAPHACQPLAWLPELMSLTRSTRHNVWIAVFIGRYKLQGDDKEIPGFYYATSPDLMSWGRPMRIMAAPIRAREERPDQYWQYPSLLDPDSRSQNFDTIDGDRPRVFFTVRHLQTNNPLNRDLSYVPLKIE